MTPSAAPLLHSPLHERHVALGAKLADFGGWEMPIEYPGGGVLKEHASVREAVGVFDVSHLGKASVVGPGASAFVNSVLSNDLDRIHPGQAQYTLCCDETGGVVDDLIAYLVGPDDVFLIPNAANTAEVVHRLSAAAPAELTVTNLHQAYAVLAVQGPRSAGLLDAVGLPTDHGYMSFVTGELDSGPLVVCRTGYTGEHGYELLPSWDAAPEASDTTMCDRGMPRSSASSPQLSRAGPAAFSACRAARPQNAGLVQPTAQPDRA